MVREIANLPDHFHKAFSREFLTFLAVLRLHGLSIIRADESQSVVTGSLWAELSHPSVWFRSPLVSRLERERKDLKAGTPAYDDLNDRILRANLLHQQKLLDLLEEFYNRRATSFWSRLIVETIDLGESYLRPQGASVRLTWKDHNTQAKWLAESRAEIDAFTVFLIGVLEHPNA